MSGSDGPAQAVNTPKVAMLVIANANQLRFNLQEMGLMPATLPLAVSFAHFRWQHPRRGCHGCTAGQRRLNNRFFQPFAIVPVRACSAM